MTKDSTIGQPCGLTLAISATSFWLSASRPIRLKAKARIDRISERLSGLSWLADSILVSSSIVALRAAGGRLVPPPPLRNSRDPNGPVLVFTAPEWDAFVAGVKLGEFDRPMS